jgi:hypothetical protein
MHDGMIKEFNEKSRPTLTVDWMAYAHHLEDSAMSDDEKREFIETLWSVVVSFIDMGFDVRSPDDACGQEAKDDPPTNADVVPSSKSQFNDATNKSGAARAKPKPPKRSM